MDVTPRYLGGGSFLGHRDPRVLILVPLLYVIAVAQIDDLRVMLVCGMVALIYYAAAGIPWRAVKANWALVLVFITMLVVVNSIITGSVSSDSAAADSTVLFAVPLLGTKVSIATLSYALTLFLRFITIAAVGFPIAFAMAPTDIGVAFARLGIPSRMAFALDLTFRFLPSMWSSMHQTMDAQKVRGYDHGRSKNPISRVLALRPVVIPVTVNALVDAEDTIDAMDLRGFGRRRTWMRRLKFGLADYLVLAGFAALAACLTVANITGFFGGVWTP